MFNRLPLNRWNNFSIISRLHAIPIEFMVVNSEGSSGGGGTVGIVSGSDGKGIPGKARTLQVTIISTCMSPCKHQKYFSTAFLLKHILI